MKKRPNYVPSVSEELAEAALTQVLYYLREARRHLDAAYFNTDVEHRPYHTVLQETDDAIDSALEAYDSLMEKRNPGRKYEG